MVAPLDRDELIADRSLVGTVLCRALSRRTDEWLAAAFAETVGEDQRFALLAVGGYGRGTLTPRSDLDVLLLHDSVPPKELESVASRLWTPLYGPVQIGHAVRTVRETIELAAQDLETATGLISLRLLAGDPDLADRLSEKAEARWLKQARDWLPMLADGAIDRRKQHGEIAFLLEPDLKNGGGGLRDVDAIGWAQAAGMSLLDQEEREVRDAKEVLLAARVELHRVTGRASNRLLLEDQDEVAAALGLDDADAMMGQIATAARTIAWISDDLWARARRRSRRQRVPRWRRPSKVSPGVTVLDGTIALDGSVRPGRDPQLVLRVAVGAAKREARIDRPTLDRLSAESAEMPIPWPEEARRLFVDLLAEGHRAIPVIEALDHTGSWTALVPEWEPNRNRVQRNAYHRFTVDRHLCEALAEASELTKWIDRPDLLLMGALFHDIGKGYPGDHAIVGMELIEGIASRMGFNEADVSILMTMVEHHLLLPDVATRLDLDDPGTIEMVLSKVDSPLLLQLLGALTEADSIATGPSAWSRSKATLVHALVDRVGKAMAGEAPEDRIFPTTEQEELLASGEDIIRGDGDTITVLVADAPGLFSSVAGALAANRLDVEFAGIVTNERKALQIFQVTEALGLDIDWERVAADVALAVDGRLQIEDRIAERISAYGLTRAKQGQTPVTQRYVKFRLDVSEEYTIVEIGAPNQVGLLYRIARAFTDNQATIDQARVQTLGDHVVDTFYIRDWSGTKITDETRLDVLRSAILQSVEEG